MTSAQLAFRVIHVIYTILLVCLAQLDAKGANLCKICNALCAMKDIAFTTIHASSVRMPIASAVTLHNLSASNVAQDTLQLMENVNLALLTALSVINWGMELVMKANAGVATQE